MKRWRERVVVIGRIALDMVDWNFFFDRNGSEVSYGARGSGCFILEVGWLLLVNSGWQKVRYCSHI